MISSLIYIGRLTRIGFVLAREGVFSLVDVNLLPPSARAALRLVRLIERQQYVGRPQRLAAALTRLGPAYVKLGQVLATRADVVGKTIADDLIGLQDKMAPFSQAEAEQEIVKAFERPLRETYASFNKVVAAASIAQVHKATTTDDQRPVAVKILRPNIRSRFKADLDTLAWLTRNIERYIPASRRLKPIEIVATLARSVAFEMDLRLEAAALSEFADNIQEEDFYIPTVDWQRTTNNILTLEWIDGIPLSDHARLLNSGINLPQLAVSLVQNFLRHAVRDGFFHADLHPGNLFVDNNNRLVAVDFGIMGRIGFKERRFLAEILYGFITRNYQRIAEVHVEAGYIPSHHSTEDFALALRAIGEPIHSRKSSDISMAKLLTQLFEITALYDMETRPELILLQKTMVVVEGVARMLDPDFNMWQTAEPVMREWIERNLGVVGQLEKLIKQGPELLQHGAILAARIDTLTKQGFVLSPETVQEIGKAEARHSRWGHLALWAIAGLLALHLYLW